MLKRGAKKTDRSLKLILSIVFSAALIQQSVPPVFAYTSLLNRTDRLSSSTISAIARHDVRFTITDFVNPVGSIRIEFCANDPLPEQPCTPPVGFDASSANLIGQSGETGFSIHANSDANNIILTRVPDVVSTPNVQYEFSNITNPSTIGTFFVRLYTFSSDDATGTAIQAGGIALSVNDQFNVSTEVLPFLRLCVAVTIVGFDCNTATSFFIDMGEFSLSQARVASTEIVAATNAPFGYSITVSGTTLTSGTNVITPLGVQAPSSPGNSQFGINLRANGSPAIGADPVGPGTASPAAAYNSPNNFRFVPGDVIASSPGTNDYRKFTVSYIANISGSQAPGIYATTLTFICLANF